MGLTAPPTIRGLILYDPNRSIRIFTRVKKIFGKKRYGVDKHTGVSHTLATKMDAGLETPQTALQ